MWRRLIRELDKGPACQLEAGRWYTRGFPNDAHGWIVIADGLALTAKYKEAQKALRQAAAHTPRDRRWFLAVQWGHLYREKRDEKRSEMWYRKAVSLHPATGTHIFLGATLAKQGRFAEAKSHYRRAIALATNSARDAADEAYYNLGLIYRAEGRFQEARRVLKRALKLDPNYTIAREALADVEQAVRLRRRLRAATPTVTRTKPKDQERTKD